MKRIIALIALALAAMSVALVAGCGGSSEAVETAVTETASEEPEVTETPPAVACGATPRPAIDNIELGLTQGGSLGGAKFVKVPIQERTRGWPEWLIAAKINGEIGVWATDRGGDSMIMAIDDVSRTYSDWGSAAQPGSRARELQDELHASDTFEVAAACVR